MLPCSMVLCAEVEEEGETAFIDQRAVAAGKNVRRSKNLLSPRIGKWPNDNQHHSPFNVQVREQSDF